MTHDRLSVSVLSASLLASLGCGGGRGNAPLPSGCAPDIGRQVPSEGQGHVSDGTPVAYKNNPPSSGPHASSLAYGKYRTEQPRERWVHSLEHGGVVVLYNCPGGCDETRARLEGLFDALEPDETGKKRLVVAPDARIPTRVAAIAWTWLLELEEADTATIGCFIAARKGKAPENL
jgi:hypothetical protein